MTFPRRQFLRVAATSPLLVVAPAIARTAAVVASDAVSGPTITDGEALSGLSLSWQTSQPLADPNTVVARVRAFTDGAWTPWIEVRSDVGHGPDDPTGRDHGPLVLIPGAEAYQIVPTGAAGVSDLRQHPIDQPGHELTASTEPVSLTTVEPVSGLTIIERSNWALRSRHDTIDCTIGSSVLGLGCRSDVGLRHGIVHHTVNSNDYAEHQVPELLQGIQRYHMDTRGWDDIGYNFVIDRFGRVWQAREGDLYEPITAGHTTGLNSESVGVAILGTFTDLDPGNAVVHSLSILLGWKLGLHGVDPLGSIEVRSAGSDLAEPGEMVLLHNISGHGDNQQTSCPGTGIYNRLPEVRATAAELVSVFGTLQPAYQLDQVGVSGWAIDRLDPTAQVEVDVVVDGEPHNTLTANRSVTELKTSYPAAGPKHGFRHTVPIDIDTTSITATARASDGRTAELMDLTLFATFIDVEPHRFFAPGVYFLRRTELTRGTLSGLFEPMDELTRGQMATFLHRFMDQPTPGKVAPFEDVHPDSYYAEAVDWLFAEGITIGTSPTTFSPEEFVTRGQMATFLWRLCGEISPTSRSKFLDVAPGAYFAEPVAWLAETGITTGVTPEAFGPGRIVTRGEMASFIHRLATTPEAWTHVPPPSPVEI